jgi:hypothetical protein
MQICYDFFMEVTFRGYRSMEEDQQRKDFTLPSYHEDLFQLQSVVYID